MTAMGEMKSDFRVDILFPDTVQDMIAEVYFLDEFLCLVSQDEGYNSMDLEIVQRPDNSNWKFKLSDFEEALEFAKKRLWDLRKTEE